MSKAHDDATINEILERRANGEKVMQLALEYNVHYRTIENYCKDLRRNNYKKSILNRFMVVR